MYCVCLMDIVRVTVLLLFGLFDVTENALVSLLDALMAIDGAAAALVMRQVAWRARVGGWRLCPHE